VLQSRPVQIAIFIILALVVLGIGSWHLLAHSSHGHPVVSSAQASGTSPDDTQVDTQGNANVIVTYRADLSQSKVVFDIDIVSDSVNLTQYNYKSNLVLTDANINPLPYLSIKASSVQKSELKAQFTSNKFPGSHFHFDVRNLGGVDDRILHFYRTL
jgi:hypothetical protein